MTATGLLPKGLALILALLACPCPAPAGGPGGSELRLGFSALAFDYEEFDDLGASLDREEGWLPGAVVQYAYQADAWLVDAGLLWLDGEADYSSPAAQSITEEEILDLELRAGWRLSGPERAPLHLLAGFGYRTWWRNIRSTASADGVDETYRWGYGLLGLRGARQLDRQTRLIADFAATRTIAPRMKVSFRRVFDDADLDLRAKNGFRARLTMERTLRPGMTLSLSPWYEYWQLGRSADEPLLSGGVPVGSVYEPRSESHNFGIQLALGWRFSG